jgi:hypothetical protein
MNPKVTFLAIVLLSASVLSMGQVNEIKSASSARRGEIGGGGSSGSAGGFVAEFFFQFMFGEVVYQQQRKLEQKHDIPSLVSIDLLLQGAAQPSSYYILNPRLRANWGLFSTDFRFNYILEEDIDGVKYLRTNDWQILQFNFVTTRDLTVRIGGGVISEAFGERNSYPEWTGGVHIKPFDSKLGGIVELRGSEARKEINGHLRFLFFEKQRLHGYLTAGAVFQRHYDKVNVWGFQGGVAFSIF